MSPQLDTIMRATAATRELLRKHRVSDEGMSEFTGVIGYYSMLYMMADPAELEVGPGAEVLTV